MSSVEEMFFLEGTDVEVAALLLKRGGAPPGLDNGGEC